MQAIEQMTTATDVLTIAKQQGVTGRVLRHYPRSGQELREYTVRMPDGSQQTKKIKALAADHA